MKKWLLWLLMGSLLLMGLSGCKDTPEASAATAEPAIPVVTQQSQDTVYAEAFIEPERSLTLRAGSGGLIQEVPVSEGEIVAAGTVLVRFDATDAELAVQQAEAGLAAAQAQLALAQAGPLPEQVAVIEAQLDAASAAVAAAAAQEDEVGAGGQAADVLDAQAMLVEAEVGHQQADEAHDDTMTCYEFSLPDGSSQEICPGLGTFEEMTRYQAEAAYAGVLAARAQLDAVQQSVDPQLDAAQAGVQTSVAQQDLVQAQLDLAQMGARDEELAVAEAGVLQAEAALAQAQAMGDLNTVDAPFDAVLTDLPVESGDVVAPGAPLATLATLDRLQVRTTDLTELDVVQVAVGQAVEIIVDAMPEQPLSGHVLRIEPQGADYLGDVLYSVIIALDAQPGWLRWGLTAQVDILTLGDN